MGVSTSLLLEDSNINEETINMLPTITKHDINHDTNAIEKSDPDSFKFKPLHLVIVTDAYQRTKQTISIQIEHTSTIKQLKEKIASILHLTAESIRVTIPNLKPLNRDELTLEDYSISNGQYLHIRFAEVTQPINVYYKSSKLQLNHVITRDTVFHLKKMIHKMHSIPIQSQSLYIMNNIGTRTYLQDQKLLNNYVTPSSHNIYLQTVHCNLFSLTECIDLTAPILDFECSNIIGLFRQTMPLKSTEIVSVRKIEKNLTKNLLIYENLLKTMDNKRESLLFHGTSIKNMDKIILNGFNRDYNKRCVYGKGTYFTKFAKTAASYSIKDENLGLCGMLVCKVIIGNYGLGCLTMNNSSLYKSDGVQQYDSLVNDLYNPSIFVINRDYHAVPLYIILFKKRSVEQQSMYMRKPKMYATATNRYGRRR